MEDSGGNCYLGMGYFVNSLGYSADTFGYSVDTFADHYCLDIDDLAQH